MSMCRVNALWIFQVLAIGGGATLSDSGQAARPGWRHPQAYPSSVAQDAGDIFILRFMYLLSFSIRTRRFGYVFSIPQALHLLHFTVGVIPNPIPPQSFKTQVTGSFGPFCRQRPAGLGTCIAYLYSVP